MKKLVLSGAMTLGLLLAAGCSSREERASDDLKTFDVEEAVPAVQSEPAERAAPGIVPTSAPGVAFAYHYGFRMPDAAISAAQEAHASACEKLGLAKCRITGMTYQLDNRDRVEGALEIAIDPLLARGFGRDAIAVVEKQEGKLRYARITGEDQNPVLDAAARRERSATKSIADLEAELARTKTEAERVNLREQIRQARAEAEQARDEGAASEAKVERTPMTFTYLGGGAGRGFAGENPVTEAWHLFVDSLATMVSFGLMALAVVLPWLALIILIVVLVRSRLFTPLRLWWGRQTDSTPEA